MWIEEFAARGGPTHGADFWPWFYDAAATMVAGDDALAASCVERYQRPGCASCKATPPVSRSRTAASTWSSTSSRPTAIRHFAEVSRVLRPAARLSNPRAAAMFSETYFLHGSKYYDGLVNSLFSNWRWTARAPGAADP
jgi:hypothetical protein